MRRNSLDGVHLFRNNEGKIMRIRNNHWRMYRYLDREKKENFQGILNRYRPEVNCEISIYGVSIDKIVCCARVNLLLVQFFEKSVNCNSV